MWLLSTDGCEQNTTVPAEWMRGWSCRAAGWLRVWHGQPLSVSVGTAPGCDVLVLGHTPADAAQRTVVARRLARGEDGALGALGGSAVVIAVRQDDVLVGGDLAGQQLVAVSRCDGRVVVGGSPRLVARAVGAELDPQWVALRLGVPGAVDVWWSGCPWRGVEVVRPGWALRVRRRDTAADRTPVTRIRCGEGGLDTAAEQVRTALDEAVSTRLAATAAPTADLSGGMDSTTITALAARSRPLPVVTMPVSGADDAGLARAAADRLGVAHHELTPPAEARPLADLISDVEYLDEPGIAVNLAQERWWAQRIAALGSTVHLTGEGGDAVLTAPLAYFADLPSRELWQHARGWARLRATSPAPLLAAAWRLRRTRYTDAVHAEADRLTAGAAAVPGWTGRISWFGPSTVEWLTPQARTRVAHLLHAHADTRRSPVTPLADAGIGDTTAWLTLIALGRQQRLYTQLAAAQGVTIASPFLDDAVVAACWRVPAGVRTTPQQLKPLLVRAMRGLVPDEVLTRSTKGDFTAAAYEGLRTHASVLRDLFTGSHLADLGVVDDNAVRATLARAAAGLPVPLGRLDALISTETWLRTYERTS